MTEASVRPSRGQFSLLTLVLVSVIVALVLGLWRSGSEIATLRTELKRVVSDTEQELERWRAEVGALKIDDPTKLHAIRIATFEDLTWKWRVFVPKGRQFLVGSQCNRIPKDGTPGAAGPMLTSGEQIVRMSIRKSLRTDQWEYVVSGGQGSFSSRHRKTFLHPGGEFSITASHNRLRRHRHHPTDAKTVGDHAETR
jgi:hypothetical protein